MNILSARTARYRARKAFLIAKLGGKCSHCSNTGLLQFDCIIPRGHAHHALGSLQRQAWYEAEADRGNLQLLCARCHTLKSIEDVQKRRKTWFYEI